MLILGRKRGERIIVDKDITVTVLEISGNHVKLGLDAPPETPIDRKEFHGALVRNGGRLQCAPKQLQPIS